MDIDVKLAVDGGVPVRSEFLTFGRPDIRDEEIDAVTEVFKSGWIGTGPRVAEFEKNFAEYLGVEHAVAVSSCSAAMHLSLLAADIGPGDEVITTPLTFPATSNAIIHVGATPVFVDVDPHSQNIEPDRIADAVTDRTRAILPVHFAGRPVDVTSIQAIADRAGAVVIEDAAHCIEGWHQGRKIGTIGDSTCFSFYPTKNLTTIEGGVLATNNAEWAARAGTLSMHGLSRHAWQRYDKSTYSKYAAVGAGFKYNMTDVEAAVGLLQLAKIDEHYKRRREIWDYFLTELADLPLELPAPVREGDVHALHLFTLFVDLEQVRVDRDQIASALIAENVGCGVHYLGLHLHPYFAERYALAPEDFPVTTGISDRTFSVPLGTTMSDADAESVVVAIRKVLAAYAR